ncbi:MAG: nuclear transport factor 2 family protein [Dehalococcoidia bacterium]
MLDTRTVERYFESLRIIIERRDIGTMLKLLAEDVQGTDLEGRAINSRKELLDSYKALPSDCSIIGTKIRAEGEAVMADFEATSESLPSPLRGSIRFVLEGATIKELEVAPRP